MKKLIAFILVLAITVCLAGCNETATSSGAESEQETNKKIGRIISYDDFTREMSKKINLDNYEISTKEIYGELWYDIKFENTISYKKSNYEITVDNITFTMPIKLSDLLDKGFTLEEDIVRKDVLEWGDHLITPKGNKFSVFALNFYGDSTNVYDCYATQVCFDCVDSPYDTYMGVSSLNPEFEIMGSITKTATIDDVVSLLGEPSRMRVKAVDLESPNNDYCIIHLEYAVVTDEIPNGSIIFTFWSCDGEQSQELSSVNYSLH